VSLDAWFLKWLLVGTTSARLIVILILPAPEIWRPPSKLMKACQSCFRINNEEAECCCACGAKFAVYIEQPALLPPSSEKKTDAPIQIYLWPAILQSLILRSLY
jgi:hypothetical protein